MNTFKLPEQIGTGGHTVDSDGFHPTVINKKLTSIIKKMLIEGNLPPTNKAEVKMIRDAKQKKTDCKKEIEMEDSMSDLEADGNALASAGYGTDEDYGGAEDRL